MIETAEVIAIVEITKLEKVRVNGNDWTYEQKPQPKLREYSRVHFQQTCFFMETKSSSVPNAILKPVVIWSFLIVMVNYGRQIIGVIQRAKLQGI